MSVKDFMEDGRRTGVVVDGIERGQARVRRLGADRHELTVLVEEGTFPVVISLDTEALRALAFGSAPAGDPLIEDLRRCVREMRDHQHPERGEDLFCLNLVAYMGERMRAVLDRLDAAERRLGAFEATRLAETRQRMGTDGLNTGPAPAVSGRMTITASGAAKLDEKFGPGWRDGAPAQGADDAAVEAADDEEARRTGGTFVGKYLGPRADVDGGDLAAIDRLVESAPPVSDEAAAVIRDALPPAERATYYCGLTGPDHEHRSQSQALRCSRSRRPR